MVKVEYEQSKKDALRFAQGVRQFADEATKAIENDDFVEIARIVGKYRDMGEIGDGGVVFCMEEMLGRKTRQDGWN